MRSQDETNDDFELIRLGLIEKKHFGSHVRLRLTFKGREALKMIEENNSPSLASFVRE
jgi:hypothetical protein